MEGDDTLSASASTTHESEGSNRRRRGRRGGRRRRRTDTQEAAGVTGLEDAVTLEDTVAAVAMEAPGDNVANAAAASDEAPAAFPVEPAPIVPLSKQPEFEFDDLPLLASATPTSHSQSTTGHADGHVSSANDKSSDSLPASSAESSPVSVNLRMQALEATASPQPDTAQETVVHDTGAISEAPLNTPAVDDREIADDVQKTATEPPFHAISEPVLEPEVETTPTAVGSPKNALSTPTTISNQTENTAAPAPAEYLAVSLIQNGNNDIGDLQQVPNASIDRRPETNDISSSTSQQSENDDSGSSIEAESPQNSELSPESDKSENGRNHRLST
jgi:ribonuclease E